jgi:hypothetical protein
MAIGDLDRDGRNEVVVTTSWQIHVLRADGQVFSREWPRSISFFYFGNPLVADMDGDGFPEVVVAASRTLTTPYPLFPLDPPSPSRSDAGMQATNSAYYYEYQVMVMNRDGAVTRSWLTLGANGMRVSGFPTSAIGDADGDGRTDIGFSTSLLPAGQSWIVDSGLTLIATGTPSSPGANDWPSPLHDNRNSSVVSRDTTAPTVALTAPVDGATITETTTVLAVASDDVFVRGVQLRVDGADVGAEDTQAPFAFAWDPRGSGNGPHVLTAVARDPAGNRTTSAPVHVVVEMDLTAPQVAITSPEAGATVSEPLTVPAEASDERGVSASSFYADQAPVASASVPPWSFAWDPRTTTDGAHVLPRAHDAAERRRKHSRRRHRGGDACCLRSPPAEGSTISGLVSLTASATDNMGVVAVESRAGEAVLGTDTAPLEPRLNGLLAPDGPYTPSARASTRQATRAPAPGSR